MISTGVGDIATVSMLAVLLFCLASTHAQSTEAPFDAVSWSFFIEEGRDRMVAVVTSNDPDKDFVDCYLFGHQALMNATLFGEPTAVVEYVNSTVMHDLVEWCGNQSLAKNYSYGSSLDVFTSLGWLSSLLIFPGTKYCGAGNISDSWDDLGTFGDTDACCREHDACPDYIDAGETQHGLTNDSPFTESNCVCDRTLSRCLQKVDSLVSTLIGVILFDIVKPQCFLEYYPVVGCNQSSGSGPFSRCEQYIFNMSAEPIWEFLDDPQYYDSQNMDEVFDVTSGSNDVTSYLVASYKQVLAQVFAVSPTNDSSVTHSD